MFHIDLQTACTAATENVHYFKQESITFGRNFRIIATITSMVITFYEVLVNDFKSQLEFMLLISGMCEALGYTVISMLNE